MKKGDKIQINRKSVNGGTEKIQVTFLSWAEQNKRFWAETEGGQRIRVSVSKVEVPATAAPAKAAKAKASKVRAEKAEATANDVRALIDEIASKEKVEKTAKPKVEPAKAKKPVLVVGAAPRNKGEKKDQLLAIFAAKGLDNVLAAKQEIADEVGVRPGYVKHIYDMASSYGVLTAEQVTQKWSNCKLNNVNYIFTEWSKLIK